MKYSKLSTVLLLPLSIIGIGQVQATDILAAPSILPLEEKGLAWDHPSAKVTGIGELKITDEGANIPVKVKYEGTITCTVSVSASAHYKNKLDIKAEDFGNEIEAKSKVGTIDISACSVTDANGITTPITETTAMTGSKVEVEIEGYYEDVNSTMVFSEYEAEGKLEAGSEYKVKLELKNGTLAIVVAPEPPACEFLPCGGGGTAPGGF